MTLTEEFKSVKTEVCRHEYVPPSEPHHKRHKIKSITSAFLSAVIAMTVFLPDAPAKRYSPEDATSTVYFLSAGSESMLWIPAYECEGLSSVEIEVYDDQLPQVSMTETFSKDRTNENGTCIELDTYSLLEKHFSLYEQKNLSPSWYAFVRLKYADGRESAAISELTAFPCTSWIYSSADYVNIQIYTMSADAFSPNVLLTPDHSKAHGETLTVWAQGADLTSPNVETVKDDFGNVSITVPKSEINGKITVTVGIEIPDTDEIVLRRQTVGLSEQ